MKFTKEDAYKELVKLMTAKGEALNLSSRSINEQLEKLMPLLANDRIVRFRKHYIANLQDGRC